MKDMLRTRLSLTTLILTLASSASAQDGRWYDMATGGAAPSAGTSDPEQIDPNVLFDLSGRAQAAAAELGQARTDEGVQDSQREVEDRMTLLIGRLEREGS
jgi:hypothetical protein